MGFSEQDVETVVEDQSLEVVFVRISTHAAGPHFLSGVHATCWTLFRVNACQCY